MQFKSFFCLSIAVKQEGGDVFDREAHQKFLGSVNFLSQYGIHALISDMEAATKVVLKGLGFFYNLEE